MLINLKQMNLSLLRKEQFKTKQKLKFFLKDENIDKIESET